MLLDEETVSRVLKIQQGIDFNELEEAAKAIPPTPSQILAQVQQIGLETPAESVDIIRGERDGH